ncbi:MAG: hypothetical protein ACAI38_24280 [Myxococcota bacterium]
MSSGDRIRRRGAQSQSINADSTGTNATTEGTGTPDGQTVRTGSAARLGETNTTGASRTLTTAQNQLGDRATTTAHSSVASFQNGVVTTTAGSRFDMTTARGVVQAQAELGANFTALQGTLEAQGFRLDTASGSWVPADAVDRGANPNKFTGHLTAELRDGDQEIIDAMAERGFPNLVNKETATATLAKLQGAQFRAGFDQAVDAVRAAIANPNAANVGKAADYINQLSTQVGANAMEILFFVFRESIQATNEDKKYFLERLQDYNLMAEKLSDYLSQLVDDSQRLSAAAAGAKYPEKVTISIEVQKFDLSTLDRDGKVATMAGYPMSKTVDRAGLNDTIKDVESMQETVRNKRQMASTAFQNFDQKANQLYNLMASVLKVMNEMRSSTTRNML